MARYNANGEVLDTTRVGNVSPRDWDKTPKKRAERKIPKIAGPTAMVANRLHGKINVQKSPLPTRPPWNGTRTVTVLWLLAFMMYALDRELFHGVDKPQEETTEQFLKTYAAWGALYIVLVAGADFEATRELAVAFALVIFISILLVAPSAKDPNQVLGVKVFSGIADFFSPGIGGGKTGGVDDAVKDKGKK